jgi:hypothetical protein
MVELAVVALDLAVQNLVDHELVGFVAGWVHEAGVVKVGWGPLIDLEVLVAVAGMVE